MALDKKDTIRIINIPDRDDGGVTPYTIEAPFVMRNVNDGISNGGVYILDENGQASYSFEKTSGFVVSNRDTMTKFGTDNLYIKTFTLETGDLK